MHMDISNTTQTAPVAPSVSKVAGGATATTKSAPQGNSLPGLGQVPVAKETSASNGAVTTLDTTELNNLVDKANETIQRRFSNLKFTVAEGTNINVVRIEDTDTGELIRQIPSETMIAIARAMEQALQGMMFEETV